MSTDTVPAEAGAAADQAVAPALPEELFVGARRIQLARWGAITSVFLLLLASLWLRTRALSVFYWIDEGLSVGIASHPLGHIPSLLQQDGSPPLYYLVLHVWMTVRGRGEVATHELSLLFALLTVPAAYWAGASLYNRRTGVMCAVLAAGAPYLTAYAQETRMYALLALLALVGSAAFVHAFVYRRRRYIPVFVVALTTALYTHNWALFLAVTAAGAFLLCVWSAPQGERPMLWRYGAVAFGAVAVLYAPWLPTLLYQARHTGAPWDLPPAVWSLPQGLYSLVGGRGAAVALLLAGGSGLVGLTQATRLRAHVAGYGRDQQRLLLSAASLFLMGFGTLVLAWVYSKTTPAWAVRYLGVVVGPLIILFGLGLARAGRLGLVALALVASFWVLDPVSTSRIGKSNMARVVASLRGVVGSDPLVLSTQPEQVPTIAYYLPQAVRFGTPMGPVPDPRVVDWRDALPRLRHSSVGGVLMPMISSLKPGQHVLLIVPAKPATAPVWLKLIGRYSRQWSFALGHDRSLTPVATSASGSVATGVGVRATLFVVKARH